MQRRADHCDLEGAGSRDGDAGGLPSPWAQLGDVLKVEGEVRRSGCVRGLTTAVARGGELPAEETTARGHARRCRAEGSGIKKIVTPGDNRETVAHAQEHHGESEPKKRMGGVCTGWSEPQGDPLRAEQAR